MERWSARINARFTHSTGHELPSLALLLVKSILANDFRAQGTWGTSGNAVKTRVEHANASLAERERLLREGKTRVRRRFNDA